MDLDFSDPGPTTLEYARLHGITVDYTTEVLNTGGITTPSDENLLYDLNHLSDDFTSLASGTARLTQEKLAVSRDAAFLLKEVISMHELPDDAFLAIEMNAVNRESKIKIKQEVPILRTDNELDLLQFGSITVPTLTNLKIPFEPVDVQQGGGFEWPSNYSEYPQHFLEQARAEKFTVCKTDLLFLQDAVQNPYSAREAAKAMATHLVYDKNIDLEHLTPPLLPMSPPLTPYIPSSPGNRLELLSDNTNSTAAELKMLEDQITRADEMVDLEDSNDAMPLITDIHLHNQVMETPHSTFNKKRIGDLKVEGPLTPLTLYESPIRRMKSVTFPEMVHQFIPELPSNFESGDDILRSDDSFTDFFKLHADEAMKIVENERLTEADTTRRAKVPIIDFTLPLAPWVEFSCSKNGKRSSETELQNQMNFMIRIKRTMLISESQWRGLTELERGLHWSPFPVDLARIKIVEKLHGEDMLQNILSELTVDNIATSSTDLWKRGGLQILDDEECDDEIELGNFSVPTDISSLARKRKAEIEEEHIEKPKHKSTHGKIKQQHKAAIVPDTSIMFGGMFSASSALHRFMRIQGQDVQTTNEDMATSDSAFGIVSSFQIAHNNRKILIEGPQTTLTTSTTYGTAENVSMPSPLHLPIPEKLPPCSFIVSATLLQQRTLFREIETIYVNADIIERDFSVPLSPSQEADILLSPSTGLIFTTLQQVKQRALPGQPDQNPIKERIYYLQSRYERLIVLISEGLSRDVEQMGTHRPVDVRDQEAIKEFEKFVANLDAIVTICFVKGGEIALSRSIVTEMTKWGLPHGSKDLGDVRLSQDETTWELFFRRAGFNPYAAQIIIASLQTPVYTSLRSSSPALSGTGVQGVDMSGLQAFIYMSGEERVRKFQALLGGTRIIRQTSALIDQRWPSAKDGFRR
ncbi:hypothetical protein B0J11DRAFT_583956 [Dendryphion nanum]|uniref:Uncharacterized protein n=1 Tax=Dendryphion nanum TaxID=256645 RepID=A0A9P9ICM4_9PLEO|nr:hypothetical protein B0J11DRAFT_583956 [Dendryphion nanum]